MTATFTATANLADTTAEAADMALADFVRVIEQHMIVKSSRVDSFSGGRVRTLTVTFIAAQEFEAAQITRDAAKALSGVSNDALRLRTWGTSPVRYIDL